VCRQGLLIVAILVVIAVGATDGVLLLQQQFGHHVLLTLLGPVLCVFGVAILLRFLSPWNR